MKHRWMKALLLGSALAATLVLGTTGCSGGDGTQKDGSTTTNAAATTNTSLNTELRPPTTTGSDQNATNTTAAGAAVGGSDSETITVGGKTAEEYEAALPGLVEKVKASPDDLAILQELAIVQYQTQRYADADKTYQSMLAIKDEAMTHNNRANVLRDWDKIDEATSEYEKAISMDPKLVIAYMNLVALALRSDPVEAIAILDRGIKQTTGDDQQRLKDMKTSIQDEAAKKGS